MAMRARYCTLTSFPDRLLQSAERESSGTAGLPICSVVEHTLLPGLAHTKPPDALVPVRLAQDAFVTSKNDGECNREGCEK